MGNRKYLRKPDATINISLDMEDHHRIREEGSYIEQIDMKKTFVQVIIFLVFETIAVTLWLAMDDLGKRRNATECILCAERVKACPKDALH